MEIYKFTYQPCPDRFNGMWGKLTCQDSGVVVWARKRPNISRGTGPEFVVEVDGIAVGFMANKDGRKDKSHKRDDGVYVRVIEEIFHTASETFRDSESGKLTTAYLANHFGFSDRVQQKKVIDVFRSAISVYGGKGWREPSPGEIEFSEEIKQKLETGEYIV